MDVTKHLLPALPYGHAALEPHIDARTMQLHHGKHHASYVDKLNDALEGHPELHGRDASWLLLNLDAVPEGIRTTVRDNAGGHLNHSMFWLAMSPSGGRAPTGPLAAAIERDFGGFDLFKHEFVQAGAALFGSGWVWLVKEGGDDGKLGIRTTDGHDNPLMQGHVPVLVNDVWEHAYYLNYENRRADYLDVWWSIVDWVEAARRFERSG